MNVTIMINDDDDDDVDDVIGNGDENGVNNKSTCN